MTTTVTKTNTETATKTRTETEAPTTTSPGEDGSGGVRTRSCGTPGGTELPTVDFSCTRGNARITFSAS